MPIDDTTYHIYLDAADSAAKQRGAIRLLAWMADTGRWLQPKDVSPKDAFDFAAWTSDPKLVHRIRYASIFLRYPGLAEIYRRIAETGGPGDAPPAEVSELLRTYSKWVRYDDKFVISSHSTGATAAVYCNWLSMLWQAFPGAPNPWTAAKAELLADKIQTNRKHDDHAWVLQDVQAAVGAMDFASLAAVRDAWLICGALLLGLSTREIGHANRSEIQLGGEWPTLRVANRDVPIGPAALSWLSRMEGNIARSSRVSSFGRLLEPSAPVWPSISRGTGNVPDFMHQSTVSKCVRRRELHVSSLRWALRQELRSHGATIREAGILLGLRQGEVDIERADKLRILAQASLASKAGLV